MVIRSVNLETVCGITSKIPDNPFNEVAFAGKSNVGKSSMINALLNRKSLARTSAQRERRRPSIFTMSMMPCIWSICPVMDMQRPLPARRKNGEK